MLPMQVLLAACLVIKKAHMQSIWVLLLTN